MDKDDERLIDPFLIGPYGQRAIEEYTPSPNVSRAAPPSAVVKEIAQRQHNEGRLPEPSTLQKWWYDVKRFIENPQLDPIMGNMDANIARIIAESVRDAESLTPNQVGGSLYEPTPGEAIALEDYPKLMQNLDRTRTRHVWDSPTTPSTQLNPATTTPPSYNWRYR